MESILGYTTEQIEKIAHNYLILSSEGFLRVEKFIKMFSFSNYLTFGKEAIEVRVKVTNAYGKTSTIKVYIHAQSDYPSVTGYEYCRKTPTEFLEMELLPNTEFKVSFEEAIAERDKKNEESKHKSFVDKLKSELNYNIKQNRKATAAKRSYKKYTPEQLEEVLHELTDIQQNYLQKIVYELRMEDAPKQTVKQFIASFTGAKKELFEAIEKSIEEREKIFFENILNWFRTDKDYSHMTEAQLIKETEQYVEMQKWNLFKAVANRLSSLDIATTLNTYFKSTNNGFEGEWSLTLIDGTKRQFTTKTIIAQGLIQRAHYRYLSHLF